VITFRDVIRRERVDEKLEYLAARIQTEDGEGTFLEAGELEQGVLDAVHARRDGWGERERILRELSRAGGAAYVASRAGTAAREPLRRARAALDRLGDHDLPEWVEVRAPEGYLHYALDPMGYAGAAERYAQGVGGRRASRAVVIGVRSVGTSLSGIVAARIGAERTATVRPRGDTGERHVDAAPALRALLLRWLESGGDVLIVDEGPGATGETFHCVARWLRSLGVDSERVILLPSHLQPPGMGSADVREFYRSSRRYAPEDGTGRVQRLCERLRLTGPEDLSSGRWRGIVPGTAGAAAIPQHERSKFRARDGSGGACLIRYAGLGRAGAEAALRAERLGSLGFGSPVLGHEDGFLVTRWAEGPALPDGGTPGPAFVRTLSRYIAARVSLFRTGQAADVLPLARMLRENATEALGEAPEGLGAALRLLERLPEREAVIPDARLRAHEWIRTPQGIRKVDAIDHGDGIRLPGPSDAAWDLAGAVVEFGLDGATREALFRACGAGLPGGAAQLQAAVDAHRAPYAACGLGEAALGVREAVDPRDRERLAAEAARYGRLLRRELRRTAQMEDGAGRRRAGTV
jgi:hypothetical protein